MVSVYFTNAGSTHSSPQRTLTQDTIPPEQQQDRLSNLGRMIFAQHQEEVPIAWCPNGWWCIDIYLSVDARCVGRYIGIGTLHDVVVETFRLQSLSVQGCGILCQKR